MASGLQTLDSGLKAKNRNLVLRERVKQDLTGT